MRICFYLELETCEFEVVAKKIPVVPRRGEQVDIKPLIKKEDLAEYEKHVRDFPFVYDVIYNVDPKNFYVDVTLTLDKKDL